MEVELRLRQADNASRWVRVSSDIQYDAEGEPARMLGAVVDIQILKEAAAARSRALADAERTSRAKDEFLATMSHELRTPLNAMLGWGRLLRQNPRAANLEHGLEVIERNAQTQARLISDLLDVSRIIGGKLRLTLEKVTVSALVSASVDVVRQAADAKGVRLIVILDPDAGSIVADPDRLQQIVWNLLSNAVKFTPRGGSVTISAQREGSTLALRVDDTGAGIPLDHLAVIFERFRQVDSSTTRAHGGLGLGLAIVRHLVEAHGGTVQAESSGVGHGATFTVRLPVRAAVASASRIGDAVEVVAAHPPSVSPTRRVLEGVRILIVDDDADSLELLRIVLENAGAQVTPAPSAGSALGESNRSPFDVVVSDIGMREMDGYAFMRAFRAHRAETPAVALTAYARAEDADRARHAGYQRHMAKPVDGAELVALIAALAVPA
jgi:signal transduction histidine kinase/CheY-like chemotaxis protein